MLPTETLQWAADAAQKYPPWVILGLLSGVGFWLIWRQLEVRWSHQRKLETERLKNQFILEHDWLTAALRADDPEEFVQIAHAIGLGSHEKTCKKDNPIRTTDSRISSSHETTQSVEHFQETTSRDPHTTLVGRVGTVGDGRVRTPSGDE